MALIMGIRCGYGTNTTLAGGAGIEPLCPFQRLEGLSQEVLRLLVCFIQRRALCKIASSVGILSDESPVGRILIAHAVLNDGGCE